jgi:hypothetical protein
MLAASKFSVIYLEYFEENPIMNPSLSRVCQSLQTHSISVKIIDENQVVVSKQEGEVFPDKGNSFWITCDESEYFLCTWSPVCYRVTKESKFIALCVAFLNQGSQALPKIPSDLCERYEAIPLSDEETDILLGEESPEG